MRFKDPGGENPFGALVAFAVDYAVEIGIGLIVTGYVVHQITRTEYFGTNRGLSTSVAMPPPRRFDQYAVAVISSLNAMDAVGFVDAMHAMAEEYNDSEPGEPSEAPVPPPTAKAGKDRSDKSTERAIKSLEKQVQIHQKKLEEYLADPDAQDNRGHLKNAPNSEIRQKIIETRARHLKKEIETFIDQINELKGGQ